MTLRGGRHSHPPNPGQSFSPGDPSIALQSLTRDALFSQGVGETQCSKVRWTKSKTDQVAEPSQRQGHAVSPSLKQGRPSAFDLRRARAPRPLPSVLFSDSFTFPG